MRAAISLAFLALLVAFPCPAWADEAPPFKVADVAAGDDERPEGWSPVLKSGVIPETAPTVKALLALGKAAGLEDGAISARSRSIQKEDGTAAVISVVGIDTAHEGFTTALADAAVKGGWQVRELAGPMRVAVVWSSNKEARPALLTWQAHLAVRKITEVAIQRSRSVSSLQGAHDLLAYLANATKIEPKAGLPHSLRANILERMQDADGALESYRKVIDQDAPVPATPVWQLQAAGRVGHLLLLKGDDKLLAEAAKALERAVELEEHATQPVQKFGNAYNLACAYSRLGRLDDAFKLLEKSFAAGKALPADQWSSHFEHAELKDPDLQPLRGDPRFLVLLKKYAPEGWEPPQEEEEEKPKDPEKKPDGDGGGGR